MFQKVAIIGVGLIGGSLGLEIKRKKLAQEVIGVGRSRANLRLALKRRLIDRAVTDISQAVLQSDLILLCAPVQTITKQLDVIAKKAKPGALIMDVGSTKGEITRKALKTLPRSVSFIGAHPMAGTEKSGAGGAQKDLFRGKICFLSKGIRHEVLADRAPTRKRAIRFWQKLGCRVVWVSPSDHDQKVAVTSHLPQLISSTLRRTVQKSFTPRELKIFSGSGLQGMLRLASSPAEMWVDICLSNSKNIEKTLGDYIHELSKVRKWVKKKNDHALKNYLEK